MAKTVIEIEKPIAPPWKADTRPLVSSDPFFLPEKDRLSVVRQRRKEIDREIRELDESILRNGQECDRLRALIDGFTSLVEWAKTPLNFERPAASVFRDLRKQIAVGAALNVPARDYVNRVAAGVDARGYEKEIFCEAEVFVVQHDWARALANAPDVDGAAFKLPYEVCAFEFQISGRAVVVLAVQDDDRIGYVPVVRSDRGWLVPDFVCWHDDTWSDQADDAPYGKLCPLIQAQIRAITIALDAEIAVSETVRQTHSRADRRHTTQPRPYHVVSLAKRTRSAVLPAAGDGLHGKRRLHFRRGHWRHYENHKTWINWMLVGDPDLGFVDKEYRL